MSSVGFTVNNIKIQTPTFAASQTKAQTSDLFKISHEDSKHIVVQVKASAVTGTVTAYLETSVDGGATWREDASVVVASTSPVLLEYYYEEESHVTLFPLARVSITTASASTTTVESIKATRRL
jgi:hypothetical protein